jgi:hypothetical protein
MPEAATAIVEQREAPALAPMSESAAIISMIERAARDPSVDIDKFERLMAMKERAVAAAAKAAYKTALAEMQPKLPVIDRKGRIVITDKTDKNKVIQSTPYALWEDTNDAIKPFLAQAGFALSFRTGVTAEGKITVTGILSHKDGHEEETTIVLMHDSSGSKNSVQAVGSSISYGKRYTAGLLLNLTSRAPTEADDDGAAAGREPTLSDEQIAVVRSLIVEVGANIAKFCAYMKVDRIENIPAAEFDRTVQALEAKRGHA